MNEQLLALYKQALEIATSRHLSTSRHPYSYLKNEIIRMSKRIAAGEANLSDEVFIKNLLYDFEKLEGIEKSQDAENNEKVILKVIEVKKGFLKIEESLNNRQTATIILELIKKMIIEDPIIAVSILDKFIRNI